jgi:hypothetical protein
VVYTDKFINIIKNDNKFVFWVKVSSTLFKLDEDVLIGVVYIDSCEPLIY